MNELFASIYTLLVGLAALAFVWGMGWLSYQLITLFFKSKD